MKNTPSDLNLTYVGYFFTHKQHRKWSGMTENAYEEYYDSILKFLNFFPKSFFITDNYTFNKISNLIKNTDNIFQINLEDTYTYKKYFKILSKEFNKQNDDSIKNELKTKIIWHFKFELLNLCKQKINSNYYCYIDSGAFRPRRHDADNFINSEFKIANFNDVVVNYKKSYMDMIINEENLFNHGHYEVPCNSMLFSKKFINILEKEYFETLDNLIQHNINTTEQRVLTVILRKYWKTNPEFFTLIDSGAATYEINFYKENW